jgi:hypothetical protein
MMRISAWNRQILPVVVISVGLHLPAFTVSAQDIFYNGEPFKTQTKLTPTAPAAAAPVPKNDFRKPTDLLAPDRMATDFETRVLPEGKHDKKEKEDYWATYDLGIFALYLSTLRNRILEHDISGPMMSEKSRFEVMRSLTSDFSDLSSRERFQSIGEIFEPELKLGIEF